VKYKIKLVAANYLPAITVALPHAQRSTTEAAKRSMGRSNTVTVEDDKTFSDMHAGKTYPFHLGLSNPLYDPIQVRLSVQRMHVATAPAKEGASPEKARRPPFAISLPTSSFSVAAFAEAWEYEDDEDMFGDGDKVSGRSGRETDGRGKVRTVGVLEKRADFTAVGGEVVIGKEARGNVKVREGKFLGSTLLILPDMSHSSICWSRILTVQTIQPLRKETMEMDPQKPRRSPPRSRHLHCRPWPDYPSRGAENRNGLVRAPGAAYPVYLLSSCWSVCTYTIPFHQLTYLY